MHISLLEQHSKSFNIWSAIIRIDTEGKSLSVKFSPYHVRYIAEGTVIVKMMGSAICTIVKMQLLLCMYVLSYFRCRRQYNFSNLHFRIKRQIEKNVYHTVNVLYSFSMPILPFSTSVDSSSDPNRGIPHHLFCNEVSHRIRTTATNSTGTWIVELIIASFSPL